MRQREPAQIRAVSIEPNCRAEAMGVGQICGNAQVFQDCIVDAADEFSTDPVTRVGDRLMKDDGNSAPSQGHAKR
jgi:hypothetical protein